jgi:hypothetical protein
MPRKELRELSPIDKDRAARLYGEMAGMLADAQGLILARNRVVEEHILEVADAVGDLLTDDELWSPEFTKQSICDQWLLMSWDEWCKKRGLTGAVWPVTIFKGEIQGALALARRSVAERQTKGGAA